MACDPAASAEVDSVACPPLSAPVPTSVAPSKNCTAPAAVAGVTVAVRVTLPPNVEGFGVPVTLVAVNTLTYCVIGNDVLAV